MAREVEASALCNKWAEGRCQGRAKLAAPDLLIRSLAAADDHRDALKIHHANHNAFTDPLSVALLWRSDSATSRSISPSLLHSSLRRTYDQSLAETWSVASLAWASCSQRRRWSA